MFAEEDLRPISALQHLAFCERQCALIHLDQLWTENRLTAEGRVLHERVHERDTERRVERIIVRGLAIRSLEHGLSGVADVVEFHRDDDAGAPTVSLPGAGGQWRPFPVEYKRGRPKRGRYDEIQLCAQALCLEEMLAVPIATGALYYGKVRRRAQVELDPELRRVTLNAIHRLHRLLSAERAPRPEPGPKCRRCSLRSDCLPELVARSGSARSWLDARLEELTVASDDVGDHRDTSGEGAPR